MATCETRKSAAEKDSSTFVGTSAAQHAVEEYHRSKGSLLKKDALFEVWDADKLWQKYCGFLDLPLDEFMIIQRALLMDQVELLADSVIGQDLMRGQRPRSVDEFRRTIPMTSYEDYREYLDDRKEDILPAKPVLWSRTSGRTGAIKWAPYTPGRLARLADDTLSAFILSSATRKGEVHLRDGVKVVLNLPPMPYTTGIMAFSAAQRMDYRAIPPLAEAERMEFQERIEEGFKMALHTGADYAASIAVVLAKVGEEFSQLGSSSKVSLRHLHPMAMLRLLQAIIKSKIRRRPMLPRDIWKIKGLVCGGTDTNIYRDKIAYYWGVQPLDVYVATEAGFIAMQGWNKKGMTFVPYSNFYEFIPEKEWLKNHLDKNYHPSTVLMDELEVGQTYEVLITNFHGGPFIRYRIGDLVKVAGMSDDETGVNLPQFVFQSRADDVIDIAGFARLDEKTIWAAIQKTEIPYEDWAACKEHVEDKPILHIYIEPRLDNLSREQAERCIDEQLMAADRDYADLRQMTKIEPLKVTILNRGAFAAYMNDRQKAGQDLAHLKPAHINPSEATLSDLLRLSHNC